MYQPGVSVEEAFVKTLQMLEGTFAITMISSHDRERIFCAREKNPLILGVAPDMQLVAPDLNAFLPYTRRAVLLDDGDYAVLTRDGYCVRSIANGEVRGKQIIEIHWNLESTDRNGYADYMEKEIWEQPDVVGRAMELPSKEIASVARLMHEAQRTVLLGVGEPPIM